MFFPNTTKKTISYLFTYLQNVFLNACFCKKSIFEYITLSLEIKKLEAEIFLSSFLRIFETILKMLFSSLRNANNANEL